MKKQTQTKSPAKPRSTVATTPDYPGQGEVIFYTEKNRGGQGLVVSGANSDTTDLRKQIPNVDQKIQSVEWRNMPEGWVLRCWDVLFRGENSENANFIEFPTAGKGGDGYIEDLSKFTRKGGTWAKVIRSTKWVKK